MAMPQRTMSRCVSGCRIVAALLAACTMPGSTPSVRIVSSARVEPLQLAVEVPVAGHVGRREVRERPLQRQPGQSASDAANSAASSARTPMRFMPGVDLQVVRAPSSRAPSRPRRSATANSRVVTVGTMSCSSSELAESPAARTARAAARRCPRRAARAPRRRSRRRAGRRRRRARRARPGPRRARSRRPSRRP